MRGEPEVVTGRLDTEHGGEGEAVVRYRVFGPPAAPVVVVLGGISATRQVADSPHGPGWWRDVVGPGRAIDTERWCVVGVDYLGRGSQLAPNPPAIGSRDQAAAVCRVLEHLGSTAVHAVVGASYGGMVALALAERMPALGRLVTLGAAHRAHPMATALRGVQRRIVRLGLETGRDVDAVAIARGLAMTTYRSADEFRTRFRGEPARRSPYRFDVDLYLEHCGERFANRLSAGAFLRLSESIDLHCVEPARIPVPATFVAFDRDAVVPPWLVHDLAACYGGPCEVREVASIYGHDAFLKETEAVSRVIHGALEVQHG